MFPTDGDVDVQYLAYLKRPHGSDRNVVTLRRRLGGRRNGPRTRSLGVGMADEEMEKLKWYGTGEDDTVWEDDDSGSEDIDPEELWVGVTKDDNQVVAAGRKGPTEDLSIMTLVGQVIRKPSDVEDVLVPHLNLDDASEHLSKTTGRSRDRFGSIR